MAEPVQLVYSDNPGDIPATYVLPPGLDLELSSVVARYNGGGDPLYGAKLEYVLKNVIPKLNRPER